MLSLRTTLRCVPLMLRAPTAARAVSSSAAANAKKLLQTADCVCFDFDSTLIAEEGIDVLAAHCGAGEAVAAWTAKAMGGSVKFEDALAARLDLIKPSRTDLLTCLSEHPPVVTPGAAERVLGVESADVFANTLFWDPAGEYTGFDATEPTSADGGKARVIKLLMENRGFQRVVMVGDGATDMQAKPPANATIGFGGVVVRNANKAGVVRDSADWFVTDFHELLDALEEDTK